MIPYHQILLKYSEDALLWCLLWGPVFSRVRFSVCPLHNLLLECRFSLMCLFKHSKERDLFSSLLAALMITFWKWCVNSIITLPCKCRCKGFLCSTYGEMIYCMIKMRHKLWEEIGEKKQSLTHLLQLIDIFIQNKWACKTKIVTACVSSKPNRWKVYSCWDSYPVGLLVQSHTKWRPILDILIWTPKLESPFVRSN